MGLVRSLHPILASANITINAVAPGATETPLLPQKYLDPIRAASLPVSTAEFVGLALVFSATRPAVRTDFVGRETASSRIKRWTGNVILTLGDQYTELEGPFAEWRCAWLGRENDRLIKAQQALAMGGRDLKTD